MDLRNYFQKIKQIESTIAELFILVISLETRDGGMAGTPTEVSRALAAKMIVDGLVRLAEPNEKQAYYAQQQAAQAAAKANTEKPAKK
jgi:hypothetical protein